MSLAEESRAEEERRSETPVGTEAVKLSDVSQTENTESPHDDDQWHVMYKTVRVHK